MRTSLAALIIVVGAAGCGESHVANPDGSLPQIDGGGGMDGGPIGTDAGPTPVDGGPIVLDAGPPPSDGGPVDVDSGPPDAGPIEPCDPPGATESVACGNCGTVERFCTSARVWAYGACGGEGECAPGTTGSLTCGDCGTQSSRCTAACVWERVGTCGGEGECTPGEREVSGTGCPAGQTREVSCDATCTFVPVTACVADACSTPGTLETVACGMCGTRERFCTSARVWEYGACGGEGVCMPGTTGTTSCGMCGTMATRCTTACTWDPTGSCTSEGVCAPGSTTRSSAGCPGGQTRLLRCSDACVYEPIEACRSDVPVDVMLLLDVTGSHAFRVSDNRTLFATRLIRPLVALGDVAVGIAFYADFPIGSYGSTGDRPFEPGIEPTRTSAMVEAALGLSPARYGGDYPESGVEALSILTGGPVPSSAIALTCTSGRTAGGCWRSGAQRVVIVYTDATHHNGPDPAGPGLLDQYTGITPAPATWPTVLASMTSQRLEMIALVHDTTARAQTAEMLSDLGQPLTNQIDATGTMLGAALDAAVARVRVIGGY